MKRCITYVAVGVVTGEDWIAIPGPVSMEIATTAPIWRAT